MKKVFIIILGLLVAWEVFAQTSNPQQYKYVFTVAKDGSGDYKYIQDAIDAMRVFPLAPITLYIRNGVYNEKIELPSNNTDVTFVGESVEKTIITFNDYSGRGKTNTFTSYTVKISGNRFVAENITFVNSAGPVGQALALYVDATGRFLKIVDLSETRILFMRPVKIQGSILLTAILKELPILYLAHPRLFSKIARSGPNPIRI